MQALTIDAACSIVLAILYGANFVSEFATSRFGLHGLKEAFQSRSRQRARKKTLSRAVGGKNLQTHTNGNGNLFNLPRFPSVLS